MRKAAFSTNAMEPGENYASLARLPLCFQLQSFFKLQRRDAPYIQRLFKDLDGQRKRIRHLQRLVHATTTSQVGNDYNVQRANDAEALVFKYISNDLKLHQPNHFRIEMDKELLSYFKVHLRSNRRWKISFKCPFLVACLCRSHGWPVASFNYCWTNQTLHR